MFHWEGAHCLELNQGSILTYSYSSTNVYNLIQAQPNTKYYFRMVKDGNNKTYYYSINGRTYTELVTFEDTAAQSGSDKQYYNCCIGRMSPSSDRAFLGAIYMDELKISLNGTQVYDGEQAVRGTDFNVVGNYVYRTAESAVMYSNFTTDNYINPNVSIPADYTSIDLISRGYHTGSASRNAIMGGFNSKYWYIGCRYGTQFTFRDSSNYTTGGTSTSGYWYWLRLVGTGNSATFYVLEDRWYDYTLETLPALEQWTTIGTKTSSYPLGDTSIHLGKGYYTNNTTGCYWSSYLDIQNTSLSVNGTVRFNGATAIEGTDYTVNGYTTKTIF